MAVCKRDAANFSLAYALYRRDLIRRYIGNDVGLPRRETGNSPGNFRNNSKLHPSSGWLATPPAFKRLENKQFIRSHLDKLVRSGADRGKGKLLDANLSVVVFRKNPGCPRSEPDFQQWIGKRRAKLHGEFVEDLDRTNGGYVAGRLNQLFWRIVYEPVKGELDILGSKRITIVKYDVIPQSKDHRQFINSLPASGKHRKDAASGSRRITIDEITFKQVIEQ